MSSSRLALVSFVIGLGSIGHATAAPCLTASLSTYQSMGAVACSVGTLNFSGFSVESFPGPTAQQIASSSTLVTPIANGLSLSSVLPISASPGQLFGLRFLFDVGAPSLIGATAALGAQNGVNGDGAITAFLDAGSVGNAIAIAIDGLSDTPVSFASLPVSSYSAFLELGIDGGTFGSASLGPTLASLTFAQSPVPEPGTMALSLLALAA
ncbi:MAG: hypothetical protein H7Z19_13495, partial [Chitinophagaceae bacterium]|nr:hypothetical protein [Rubrivivax sp.]